MMTTFFTHLAACIALAGGTWKLFTLAEEALNEDAKKRIGIWLSSRLPNEEKLDWLDTFSDVLAAYFGDKLVSRRSIIRSILTSLSSIFIAWTVVLAGMYQRLSGISPDGNNLLWSNGTRTITDAAEYIGMMLSGNYLLILTILPYNLIIDFGSLIQSRILLSFARRRKYSISRTVFVDALCTFTICVISILLVFLFFDLLKWERIGKFPSQHWRLDYWGKHLLETMNPLHGGNDAKPVIGAMMTAICFTSIWLWTYLGGSWAIKRIQLLSTTLDLQNKPLSCIGLVASISIASLYIFAQIIYRLTVLCAS